MATVGEAESSKTGSSTSEKSIWLATGFFCLGGSIGFISGLSDAAVTLPLIAALLALFGGGFIPLLTKVERGEREVLGKLLCAFAVSFSLFISAGLVIKVNGFFVFHAATQDKLRMAGSEIQSGANSSTTGNATLLKSEKADFAAKIESLCRNANYAELHDALREIK